ncbi:hypothetical protein QJS10_CPA03g00102 [Acorus calamus]|uniref:Uncharacterized protein n=1 Tax=Acorus calamus TaxID=4465 RepID=A0AAV9F6Z8_ACOCL|nr:hypothetical protein QJS10_CPA03g00102 [Acorus calamus]
MDLDVEPIHESISELGLDESSPSFAGIPPLSSSSQVSAPIDIHLPRLGSLSRTSIDSSLLRRHGNSCHGCEVELF